MADSVAYQHTDGNRNYDGSYKLHGIKKLNIRRDIRKDGLGGFDFVQFCR